MTPLPSAKVWLRQLRVHQWAKNLLVFVPLLAAHRVDDFTVWARGMSAFVSFSLTASAVYLANDLADLEHDRRHPRKKSRPLAAGQMSAGAVRLAGVALLVCGLSAAVWLGADFGYWLLGYLGVTTAYTLVLKRLVIVDALTLAALYVLRLVAGGVATATPVSQWLLAFSLFLFLSLAFAKRYTELVHHLDADLGGLAGRGYRRGDAEALLVMGIASGFASVLILSLYLSSPAVAALYAQQELLWLTLPVVVFWLCWLWLCAHRGDMHDDPVVFSLTDRRSQISAALFALVIALAAIGGPS